MLQKLILIPVFISLVTACGKGGTSNNDGNNRENGSDKTEDQALNSCGTSDGNYYDTGYASGLKLKPGQMGSDIADAPIPACVKGQFVFNGSCWDAVSFDETSGEIDFITSSRKEVILKPNVPLTAFMTAYAKTIHSYIDRCDTDQGIGTTVRCNVWMGHYPSIYYFDHYTSFMLQDWSMEIAADNFIARKTSYFKFRTSYGTCFKKNGTSYNTYDWYHNGTISFSGTTVKLPLSKNIFLSISHDYQAITCPYLYNYQWVCYQVNTNWGNEILYFDENSNLNYMTLNYN